MARQYPLWQVSGNNSQLKLALTEAEKINLRNLTVQQNLQIMRTRIEELGITEALVQRQGESRIRIELPGVQDPAAAKSVIGATATLAFYEVKDSATGAMLIKDKSGNPVPVARKPVLTGEHIVDARAGIGEMGTAEVNITLDSEGGRRMTDFSRAISANLWPRHTVSTAAMPTARQYKAMKLSVSPPFSLCCRSVFG